MSPATSTNNTKHKNDLFDIDVFFFGAHHLKQDEHRVKLLAQLGQHIGACSIGAKVRSAGLDWEDSIGVALGEGCNQLVQHAAMW